MLATNVPLCRRRRDPTSRRHWILAAIVCRGVEPAGHWAKRWEAIEKIGPWW